MQAVLEADGLKMLASVLRELKLERSIDLVTDWNDSSAETVSPKNASAGRAAGKANDVHIDSLGETGEEDKRE